MSRRNSFACCLIYSLQIHGPTKTAVANQAPIETKWGKSWIPTEIH